MTSSIKQLINIIISFVDRTFLPLLDPKLLQPNKAIQQWCLLKNFIWQNQHVQIWKIQKFIMDMPLRSANTVNATTQLRKKSTENTDKLAVNIRNGSYLQNQQWKYRYNQNISYLQGQRKQNYIGGVYNGDVNVYKQKENEKEREKQKQREEKIQVQQNIQQLQNILSSFRKLCTNFENNHKKLVMDRQAFIY